jgi:thiol:disulfide interchange protein/DsbC/DsbD-like thiol-disulfide interchange protein
MRSFQPTFILVLLGALLAAPATLRASDAIPGTFSGGSAIVTQPHVTAELIPESTLVAAGKTTGVILHLHMDPDWHTYWINPGDAGLATTIKWTLPPGWTAGPIQWPTPEKHAMGPLTTYGYGGDVYLLTTLKSAPDQGAKVIDATIHAHATWLVCQEECIPGKADLNVTLHVAGRNAVLDYKSFNNAALFAAARARLPVPNNAWNVSGNYRDDQLHLMFLGRGGDVPVPPGTLSFYCEQSNVVGTKSNELLSDGSNSLEAGYRVHVALTQNGEKPDHLSGVLVSSEPLIGKARAIYIASFPVDAGNAAPTAGSAPAATSNIPATSSISPAGSNAPIADSLQPNPVASSSADAPTLAAILLFAFLGGLILNLMPCVLPVLSLKVFSLIRHAGENAGGAWKQGVAFTAGVVISFWILAGLLIALESAGSHLGWGFQMQSPGFVLALTFLFFLLSLNLFGVFELGTSLVGLDAKATSHLGGLTSSFANGALATLAATPCTAPFMGSAVGFAAQQPAAISLLVFTFLALGMAAPYLALTTFPGALRLVPKPGRWMEALRQFMGFLLMGTVIFLVYVFGALVGTDDVPMLLGTLLLAALAAWIFGRGTTPVHGTAMRFVSTLVALLLLGAAVAEGARLSYDVPGTSSSTTPSGWQAYSPDAVQAALKQGHPVFVDFTAAWCLSCKVNEQVALDIDSTKKAFAQKHVALFRGDWTHSDPEISKTLREFNRDGVPLYLLYSPRNPATPQVLPEVLTPGIVQDALQKVP